jgi:hypothetical protein
VLVAPLGAALDVLGYVHRPGGRLRVRRRSVRRLWRRLRMLEMALRNREVPWLAVRSAVASWIGLACHADAFTLSRSIFERRDVRHIGKRMLVRHVAGDASRVAARRRYRLDPSRTRSDTGSCA